MKSETFICPGNCPVIERCNDRLAGATVDRNNAIAAHSSVEAYLIGTMLNVVEKEESYKKNPQIGEDDVNISKCIYEEATLEYESVAASSLEDVSFWGERIGYWNKVKGDIIAGCSEDACWQAELKRSTGTDKFACGSNAVQARVIYGLLGEGK